MKIEQFILTIIISALFVAGCNKSTAEMETACVDNTLVSDAGVEVEEKNTETDTQASPAETIAEDSAVEENEASGYVYTYDIDICEEDEELYARIRVEKDNEEISLISLKKSECGKFLPKESEMIWEEDVDFDGNMDVLICLGGFEKREAKRFQCYLFRDSQLKYCEGFETIESPLVYKQCQLLVNRKIEDDGISIISRYVIEDDAVKKSDSVEVDASILLYFEVYCDLIFNREHESLQAAYQYIVNSFERSDASDEYDFTHNYDLIYFNDDDIPELVVGVGGISFSMFTYHDGKHYLLTYERVSAHRYQYLERKNVLWNFSTIGGGSTILLTYYEMTDSHELAEMYTLKETCLDEDGNVIIDEAAGGEREFNHYYREANAENIPITEEEFLAYMIGGEYIYFDVKYEKDEILRMIEEIGVPDGE